MIVKFVPILHDSLAIQNYLSIFCLNGMFTTKHILSFNYEILLLSLPLRVLIQKRNERLG